MSHIGSRLVCIDVLFQGCLSTHTPQQLTKTDSSADTSSPTMGVWRLLVDIALPIPLVLTVLLILPAPR